MPRAARTLLFFILLPISLASGAAEKSILVYGDSISAAYGMAQDRGWVALLGERLKRERPDYSVVNASVSGETSSGGLARIDAALARHKPSLLILELGGNDGLRGLPIPQVRSNLESLVELSRKAGARVMLVGMRIPPNYGPTYTADFHRVFGDVSARLKVPLVPFFLDGIALDDDLMQEDGLHPTAAAQPRMLDQVWPVLTPLLTR
jgi:acyl-CoA thioesterase-1